MAVFEVLERRLGYVFKRRALLQEALTHRSFGLPHNERLEFLGDGVLDCAVARLLFERFPAAPEGDLSRFRANLVNQASLAELAGALELGQYLALGEGELRSGGRERPSMLADALEALFGAIWIDGGFDAAYAVIAGLYHDKIHGYDPDRQGKDAKTRLQEWLQARRHAVPDYALRQIIGKSHEQLFEVECRVPALGIFAVGTAKSRRAAEQEAAAAVLQQLEHSV